MNLFLIPFSMEPSISLYILSLLLLSIIILIIFIITYLMEEPSNPSDNGSNNNNTAGSNSNNGNNNGNRPRFPGLSWILGEIIHDRDFTRDELNTLGIIWGKFQHVPRGGWNPYGLSANEYRILLKYLNINNISDYQNLMRSFRTSGHYNFRRIDTSSMINRLDIYLRWRRR